MEVVLEVFALMRFLRLNHKNVINVNKYVWPRSAGNILPKVLSTEAGNGGEGGKIFSTKNYSRGRSTSEQLDGFSQK